MSYGPAKLPGGAYVHPDGHVCLPDGTVIGDLRPDGRDKLDRYLAQSQTERRARLWPAGTNTEGD